MSDTSSTRSSKKPGGTTGHPAFSMRKTPSKIQARFAPLSRGLTSDSASVITSSSATRHLQVKTYYENTYKTEPDQEKKFTASSALKDTIREIMEAQLKDVTYETDRCSFLSQDLSRMIKQRIQGMNFERYKLIVTTMVGENTGQNLQMASRFLWNNHTDNFATVEYKNGTLFAVATVYAVYFD